MSAVLGGEMSPHVAVKPPERVPKCRARQIVSQGIYCSVEPIRWAVAREVLDGLPSRASAGSTLCARCSTGVAAVGPRLGGDGDLDLRGDGDLDLCGDRSLLLSRRVSAARIL